MVDELVKTHFDAVYILCFVFTLVLDILACVTFCDSHCSLMYE